MRALLFFSVAVLVAAAPARGQDAPLISAVPSSTFCELPAPEPDDIYEGVNRLRETAPLKNGGGATFEVDYTGFTPQAQAAFQFAVDIWAAHITSPVPIKIAASFETLPARVLGSAGAGCIHAGGALPVPNTWYPAALADALTGVDQYSPGGPCGPDDIVARFSSSRSDWYFGTDGNPPRQQIDFVSVVMHEIGHGLGFAGSGTVDDGEGTAECNGTDGFGCYGLGAARFPIVFDRFMEDGEGNSILDRETYANPSLALGVLFQSGSQSPNDPRNLFYDSPTTFAIYGNQRPPIWAPATFDLGSSYSHWDEVVIRQGDINALMTPQIAQGEAFQDPGPLTCALMQDIGWSLAPACATLVDTPNESGPLASGLGIEFAGPNPFRDATALRVRVDAPETIRATLYDALGREAGVLYDGPASGDVTLRVGGDLAPGIYVVRVQSETETVTERLVRVR
ncbi:T9SS type A sorting domain-containing protein [Rubricoccus marinus]|uniref:Secretion system C-terminal sorting domain-containing protein n=1 Tax=Rubricoccus marinus TaxID=716817 RepID=A0A259TW56_9BACT|nr:T9SS type A sorting domain-containing protein [Rubricoccus marinus]OZC01920.1 hypothetical protein BSZ36_02305 [Rubricoccus marinus]